MSKHHANPSTIGVHAGSSLEPSTTPPMNVPLVGSTTFHFPSRRAVVEYNEKRGPNTYLYSRYENPTVRALEQKLAVLEGTEGALMFSSGMAAIATAVLAQMTPRDDGRPLLCSSAIYGGAYRLFRDQLVPMGLPIVFVEPDVLRSGDWPVHPRAVYGESPINPTTRLIDLERLARRCRDVGALSIVDSTFATPILQRPADLGIDVVIHSATKYLGGHSDVLAGAVLGKLTDLKRIEALRKLLGGVLAPEPAALLARSLKTLDLRVRRQCESAAELAHRLARDSRVKAVLYPGLESHPDHALAKRQMKGFGGIVTIDLGGGLDGGERAAERLFDALGLFARATSLGGAESLASLPIDSSHHGFDDAELKRAGVTRGMVRLSVGLEDLEDLWRDLDQALGQALG